MCGRFYAIHGIRCNINSAQSSWILWEFYLNYLGLNAIHFVISCSQLANYGSENVLAVSTPYTGFVETSTALNHLEFCGNFIAITLSWVYSITLCHLMFPIGELWQWKCSGRSYAIQGTPWNINSAQSPWVLWEFYAIILGWMLYASTSHVPN